MCDVQINIVMIQDSMYSISGCWVCLGLVLVSNLALLKENAE